MQSTALGDQVRSAIVIKGKRDTQQLESALKDEGFNVFLLSNELTQEQENYSRIIRGLIGHIKAWELCASRSEITLVVEDDFVPVVGLSKCPLPFMPEVGDAVWGWLYCCSPRLTWVSNDMCAKGFCAAPVATLVSPLLARELLTYAAAELAKRDPTAHWGWDGEFAGALRARGFSTYLPYRNYGEHGGSPNPEHALRGLPTSHYADVLWAPLHFLPEYADGSKVRFLTYRFIGRLKGWGRLLTGTYCSLQTLKTAKPGRVKYYLRFSVMRLLKF